MLKPPLIATQFPKKKKNT
uniref:Uncharacterized protein n=1 Tax=Anopheles arabiensis TaxID=7173 RepID=A0A182IHI1_ANOAR